MTFEEVKKFAEENGYATAYKLDPWNGYEVYEPIMDEGAISYTGVPLIILVKGDEIRMSTPEEAYKQIEDMSKEEI